MKKTLKSKTSNVKNNSTTLVDQIRESLDNISTGNSDFEFQNFFLESYPTPARQLVAVMKRIEELTNSLESSKNLGVSNPRETAEYQNELKILSSWYLEVPNKENILSRYEAEEPEYWSYVLGRNAAMEILSYGRTTKETMDKMSHLPEKNFEEAVQTCMRFANLIRSITENVEQELTDATPNVAKT